MTTSEIPDTVFEPCEFGQHGEVHRAIAEMQDGEMVRVFILQSDATERDRERAICALREYVVPQVALFVLRPEGRMLVPDDQAFEGPDGLRSALNFPPAPPNRAERRRRRGDR